MSDSKINMQTMIITVVISVILSSGISYMIIPIVGPMGPQGPSGPAGPAGPGFGKLIYDSGWIAINQSEHKDICTLDDQNVFVYMIGRQNGVIIHQIYYGGERYYWHEGNRVYNGARWSVDSNSELRVYRYEDDMTWQEVRVLVWQLPP